MSPRPSFRLGSFEARWRSRFTDYARARDDDAGIAGWSSTGLAARFRFFERQWSGAEAAGVWLDVGCGAGTYARYLARHGAEVVGVDYSLPSLAKARARSPAGVHWAMADARALPVGSAVASGVLCFGVTQALADSRALLEELARVTCPGGTVWVDGLNGWCLPNLAHRLGRWLRRRPQHLRYESPRYLKRLARRAGFEHVQLLWLPILPSRLHRFQKWLESPRAVALLQRLPLLALLLSHSMVIRARRAGAA